MSVRVSQLVLVVPCLLAGQALAQEPAVPRDDLDVTMQIIVDPDAKLPDEVVRRIPLPARKPAAAAGKQPAEPDPPGNSRARDREAQELGRDASERARERGREAAEQREQARRSAIEERRRRERGPPDEPPGRPPPRR